MHSAGSKRFRPERYRPEERALGELDASFSEPSQERRSGRRVIRGRVLDFSNQGIGLVTTDAAGSVLFGDRLSDLTITQGEHVFYEGRATVRNVRETDEGTHIGLAIDDGWLDLKKLHHVDVKLDVDERIQKHLWNYHRAEPISRRFKANVADLRYFLTSLKDGLEKEEERIRDFDLDSAGIYIQEVVKTTHAVLEDVIPKHVAALEEETRGANQKEKGVYEAYFREHLLSFFVDHSPLLGRCYRKPLGYAGDYEVMNMMYRDPQAGAPSLYGRCMNVFACNLSATRAVANRIPCLADWAAVHLEDESVQEVASIACGPAREILELTRRNVDFDGRTVTLMDIEPRAIQYCEQTLMPELMRLNPAARVRPIRESVRRLIREQRLRDVLGSQGLIISVGLFDYFNDRMFEHLLGRLYGVINPGGHIYIGNFSLNNDSRFIMEYVTEWYLHHRSEDDLLRLAASLPENAFCEVLSEPLGVNLFLHVQKPRG